MMKDKQLLLKKRMDKYKEKGELLLKNVISARNMLCSFYNEHAGVGLEHQPFKGIEKDLRTRANKDEEAQEIESLIWRLDEIWFENFSDAFYTDSPLTEEIKIIFDQIEPLLKKRYLEITKKEEK